MIAVLWCEGEEEMDDCCVVVCRRKAKGDDGYVVAWRVYGEKM